MHGNHNLLATIDPLGYSNQFFYDAQNNLTLALDANQNPTTYGYNPQFSMTGQTNGMGDWVEFGLQQRRWHLAIPLGQRGYHPLLPMIPMGRLAV